MKILLAGHGCAPGAGSEPGVTWNWAASLARDNDVWVITHEHFRPAIEAHLAVHPMPRLRFVYTGRMGWWDRLELPSQRGIRRHYLAWRRHVLRLARTLDAEHDFDVTHHVGWNTVSAPPLLWQLGKPFVWGPVGGGQTTPMALLPLFGAAMPMELLRTLRVRLLPLLPGVRRAATRSDLVFAVNRETAAVLRRAGAVPPPLMLDCGVPQALLDAPCPPRPAEGPFTVLWVGRISPEKAFGLCLEAARLTRHPEVRFVVVGDGPGAEAARGRVRRLGLDDRVQFLGRKPWEEVQALLRTAHLFLFTSIRDTSGNTALEALAAGAPVVCIDHQGVGAHLPPEAAVKLPPAGPAALARGFADAIEALAGDRERLADMSAAARRYARSVGWDVRAAAMQAHYRMLLQRRAQDVAPRPVPPAATGVAAIG